MGQGSSQPMNGGLSEPENQDMSENRDAVGSSGPPKTSKKVKSETQVEGAATPKRKRKQTVNDTNTGMPSDTPNQLQESPLDQAGARPVKRTKTAPSTANAKEARRSEKNGNREAISSPQTPVIANISETGEARRQSMNMQSLTDVAHTNGTASKKPKKSKAKTTQQDEEKEVSALPQSPAETKLIRMASANPSLADSSTDQKDLTDTSAARGPRRGKTDKMIGFFAPSEVSALETFKLQFCNQHAISSDRFDRMVQHVDRRKDSGWPCDEIIKKPDFWQQIYDVLPSRDRRSVYRFMRRHFQDSSQKPHHWTHEQDDELIELVGRYGPRFAHIAKLLGRVEDDVVQRWKNRLEHRSTMRRGAWSEEEVRGLLDALQASWNNLRKDGQDVGRDIYEMDEGLVSWGTVSNKLQNCRSRQQCADKWRKIRRKIMGQRSTGNQNAVYDPATEAKPQGRAKSITLAEQMEMERMLKSSEYVDSEDGDEEDMEQSAGTESQSPNIKDEGESAEKESTIMSAPEKSSATSAKALKGSQSKESQTGNDDDSESEASSDSAESASDDAEAEIKSGSGSGSDSHSESSIESDAKVNGRIKAQSLKAQVKDVENNKASAAKSSSKPTTSTPNQKLVERSKPKTSDGKQPRSQATKTSASDLSVKAETKATPQAKASKPSKSTTKDEGMSQTTSPESESDSESASDSSEEDESTSSSEEPSDRRPTKVAPKTPTPIQKASVKGQVSRKIQNEDESEETSSASDETSSGDDSTEDSEADDDSRSASDSSASDDKPVESPKTAALKGTKRKAQEPAERTGKSELKRLKTGQKPSKKSSPSSASASSSSEDSESEDDTDSDSEADTDESSSAPDSSDSTSKAQLKDKSVFKQPTAQPKVPKAVNGQKSELLKSRTPAVSKEGSNAKNGQSGAKQKSKQVKPSLPQVKKDGEKEKGKLGSTPMSKGKKSK
ncbi:MYB DNA-binding domain protein [Aspergillus novofumigatus IBT 16806]|uniref:MYB DNA-binding domain protein n=1 Tax=Aspergillus novofumigatus (strain IBT 16806) TaxID=1392255 RepID=A0A2I1CKJ2_ASPN1|nr:uncharacterized protein P174DRAFT_5097 [Aspergillus novofumigatus IBT 16806]PKX98145.1 hypothetical protein P174DRAFT_5097 [Aspergillus novofumigatus IBT 16806]